MASELIVVDDDEDIREFLQVTLSEEGFHVRTASGGPEALNLIHKQRPDVMLVDFMMPGMTGQELCHVIKEDPDLHDIGVFIVSARADVQTKVKCFDSGADEYLVKPVDPAEIVSRIGRFLKNNAPITRNLDKEAESVAQSKKIGKEKYGPYVVDGLLGSGGMGHVLKAMDLLLERPVAIKVLAKRLSDSAEFVQRFRREARLLASIDHPGIAIIYTFGEEDSELYFAMQWCSGGSLSELIQDKKKIDVATATDCVLQCARSLAAAAKKGIVHRDIKPSNLMFDEDGRVKLVDFGLAFSEKSTVHLTAVSEMLGTPLYMSPEQTTGKTADLRSDIYSLGITFYHMLYGKVPFGGTSAIEIMVKHATQPLPPYDSDGGKIPPLVHEILERMTQKEPSKRYQNYDALIDDLLRVNEGLRRLPTGPELDFTIGATKDMTIRMSKTQYGVYALETEVGSDYSGKVYKGFDGERFAAVRVFSKECCQMPGFLERMQNRIKVLSSLNHKGIATPYDFINENGEFYIAQEWCSGGSLGNLVRKKGKLAPSAAISLTLQCASALESAHQGGMIHGNLRPNNMLLDHNQEIKIVDLAWAGLTSGTGSQDESGSLQFLAPERADANIDARVDIYSLGLIFYYMLYGIVPFDLNTTQTAMQTLPPYDDLGGDIKPDVYRVIEKMTQPSPDSRYPDWRSLILDVEALRFETSPEATIVVPRAEMVNTTPALAYSNFFEMLSRLYTNGLSGVVVLRWSVLQTRLIVRQREIVHFESNQPSKNIWRCMVKAHSLRVEDLPGEEEELEAALRSLLARRIISINAFKDANQKLMKQVVDEIFIWPVCEAEFFGATVEKHAINSLRLSDILLEAVRNLTDVDAIRARYQTKSLIRRTARFEQLLSSFNLSAEESYLAYRVEGEDVSLESLGALTGFPEEKILRFVHLLSGIGAIDFRSPSVASDRRRVNPQYKKEVIQPLSEPTPVPATTPTPIGEKHAATPAQVPFEKALIEPAVPVESAPSKKNEVQRKLRVAEHYFQLAEQKYDQGDYWQAAHLCQEAINTRAQAKYYGLMAIAYCRHPRFQKNAEEAFHEAIRLDPTNPEYHVYLANFYMERKLLLRARSHTEMALRIDSDHSKALAIKAALKSEKLGDGSCWCAQA